MRERAAVIDRPEVPVDQNDGSEPPVESGYTPFIDNYEKKRRISWKSRALLVGGCVVGIVVGAFTSHHFDSKTIADKNQEIQGLKALNHAKDFVAEHNFTSVLPNGEGFKVEDGRVTVQLQLPSSGEGTPCVRGFTVDDEAKGLALPAGVDANGRPLPQEVYRTQAGIDAIADRIC